MGFFSSIGKLFGLGGGQSSAPSGLYGTEEHKKDQAKQSWDNYNHWSTELDERFERDQASARVRSGASGGTSGALDMQLASIEGEYEKEREQLEAGESKKYLDDYRQEQELLGNQGEQSNQDFYSNLFTQDEAPGLSDEEVATKESMERAKTAASGRLTGGSPWLK